MIHAETKVLPVGDLTPWPGNPRRGNIDVIAGSLKANGQYRPLVVRTSTLEVLAGNHTLAAAKQLGWGEVAVTLVDCDEETARRIVLVDNRSNDLAGYDEKALLALAAEVSDLTGTGWTDFDLEELALGLDQEPAEADAAAGDIPDAVVATARTGDVIELGSHRVACGDSTDPAVVAALMRDDIADAMWTDPPYGVDYVGRTADALPVHNDGLESLPALLADAFAAVDPVLRGGGAALCRPRRHQPCRIRASVQSAGVAWPGRPALVWRERCRYCVRISGACPVG